MDWFADHNIHFEAVKTAFIDGTRTWHMYKGGHGTVLIQEFTKQIKEKGGQILTSTPQLSSLSITASLKAFVHVQLTEVH